MIKKDRDFLQISSRNHLVNNETVFFSTNITKFSENGYRYETSLILTENALYNFFKNTIKRRTPIELIDEVTVSTRSSEFVVHVKGENDFRFHIQDLRNQIIEALIYVVCSVRKLKNSIRIYEMDEINLTSICTSRTMAKLNKPQRPKPECGKLWTYDSWQVKERESFDRRAVIRRKTQTLYVTSGTNRKEVCLEDFELLKMLGKGAFAKVLLAQKKDDSRYYAIKILKKANIIKENQLAHTLAEKNVLQHVNHPFLVNLEYAFQTESKLYFVLNLMVGGDLYSKLKFLSVFPELTARFYTICVVSALGFLHSQNYVYRDLKLENILLNERGYAVLTDFGLAKFLPKYSKTLTFCGTPDYMAPEVVKDAGHDHTIDWWSLGILVYEMLYGKTPFFSNDQHQLYKNIVSQQVNFPDKPVISSHAKDLITKLLQKDPTKRIGRDGDSKEILSHPWFFETDVKGIIDQRVKAPFEPDIGKFEKDINKQFLDGLFIRDTIEQNISPNDKKRILDFEKDFEMMNFNKDHLK